MAAKSNNTVRGNNARAPPPPKTVAEAMGDFTEAIIKRIGEAGVTALLEQMYNIANGIGVAALAKPDELISGVGAQLRSLNIGVPDTQKIAAMGNKLIALQADRDEKDAQSRTATHALEQAKDEAHTLVMSYSHIIRGKLGPQSSMLANFGISTIGGSRGPRHKAASNGSKNVVGSKKNKSAKGSEGAEGADAAAETAAAETESPAKA